MNQLTDWDEINNHKFSVVEEKIVKKVFQEFVAGNSSLIDEMSRQELGNLFFCFKHGWVMASLISKSE